MSLYEETEKKWVEAPDVERVDAWQTLIERLEDGRVMVVEIPPKDVLERRVVSVESRPTKSFIEIKVAKMKRDGWRVIFESDRQIILRR